LKSIEPLPHCRRASTAFETLVAFQQSTIWQVNVTRRTTWTKGASYDAPMLLSWIKALARNGARLDVANEITQTLLVESIVANASAPAAHRSAFRKQSNHFAAH
jgi:hypothetical protein